MHQPLPLLAALNFPMSWLHNHCACVRLLAALLHLLLQVSTSIRLGLCLFPLLATFRHPLLAPALVQLHHIFQYVNHTCQKLITFLLSLDFSLSFFLTSVFRLKLSQLPFRFHTRRCLRYYFLQFQHQIWMQYRIQFRFFFFYDLYSGIDRVPFWHRDWIWHCFISDRR